MAVLACGSGVWGTVAAVLLVIVVMLTWGFYKMTHMYRDLVEDYYATMRAAEAFAHAMSIATKRPQG